MDAATQFSTTTSAGSNTQQHAMDVYGRSKTKVDRTSKPLPGILGDVGGRSASLGDVDRRPFPSHPASPWSAIHRKVCRALMSVGLLQDLLQTGPNGPLLALAHAPNQRAHELEESSRLNVPYPCHPRTPRHRLEEQFAHDIHVR
jgi:hypothetical protein